MNERLLYQSSGKFNRQGRLPVFNPHKCPPDLALAQYHSKATKIGKIPTDLSEQLVICPCCDNVINKEKFGLMCNVEQFAQIGFGYTLFFILYKYFAIILLFISLVSGGAFFFIVSFQCSSSCVKFLGIPIMSEKMAFSQSMQQTQIIHILTAVLILVVVIIVKHFISHEITRVEKKVLCPSQYTIMVQNMPRKKLDVNKYKKWFYDNFNYVPILINVAYNTEQFFKTKQKRQQLQIEKNRLILKRKKMIKKLPFVSAGNSLQLTNTEVDHQIKSVQKRIQQQKKTLQAYYSNQIQHRELGTVFLTFNSADEAEKILETHEKTFLNVLVQSLAGIFSSNKLTYEGKQLVFSRAPAPRQIIWQNLEFSYMRNIFFEFCFILGMLLFMFLTFRIQFWFVNRMYHFKHQGEMTGNTEVIIQAVLMSVVIMILNILLRITIQFLTKLRKSYSFTKQESSFCTYYSLIFIVNSCFTIYIVHGKAVENSNKQLLIDIHTIMLTNAFSEPLFKIFDPIMWLKMFRKIRIQKMNQQEIPYTQSYIQRLWQGHEISNADNYQYIIRVLFITIWFANVAPLGVLFSLLGMVFDYWIIKFLFVNVYKQPKNLSKKIAKSLNFLQILPLVYIGGVMPFLYQITFTLEISTIFDVIFHYGLTTIAILICILGYLYKYRPESKYVTEKKYSDVDLAFGFNYETENPFTKFTGEKRFLQHILRSQKSFETESLIKNILDETSAKKFIRNNPYVNKLKLTFSRKIQSKIQSNEPLQIEMKKIHSEEDSIRSTFPIKLRNNISNDKI